MFTFPHKSKWPCDQSHHQWWCERSWKRGGNRDTLQCELCTCWSAWSEAKSCARCKVSEHDGVWDFSSTAVHHIICCVCACARAWLCAHVSEIDWEWRRKCGMMMCSTDEFSTHRVVWRKRLHDFQRPLALISFNFGFVKSIISGLYFPEMNNLN